MLRVDEMCINIGAEVTSKVTSETWESQFTKATITVEERRFSAA